MHSIENRVVYRFGPFRLQPARRRLLRDGEPLNLTPKALDVLVTLVEARGAVVERHTLMDRVWPDTAVVDANLTQTVSVLRKSLGDTAGEHLYIATVPGRGYQFTAPVEAVVEDRRGQSPPPAARPADSPSGGAPATLRRRDRPSHRGGHLLVLFAALSVLALLVVGSRWISARENAAPYSLAVLPLTVLTPSAVDPALGVGLSDAITNRLSNQRTLTVRPTQTVLATTAGEPEPVAAGRKLRVSYVLTGTVRRAGDQVRASVQLFDVDGEQTLWAATFDQPADSLFTLEDQIADQVARSLSLDLAESMGGAASTPATGKGLAYEELILGRARYLERNAAGYQSAARHFERALEHDPDYAPALGNLALVHVLLAANGSSPEPPIRLMQRSRTEARRAIAVAPGLPEAHVALGTVRMLDDYDWAGAIEAYERAVQLDPTSFRGRYLLSTALILAGDEERAWAEALQIPLHRAVTDSMVDVNHEYSFGLLALFLGRHEEAREALTRVVAARPDLGGVRMYLAVCLDALGRREAALAEIETAIPHFKSSDLATATLAHYLGRSGDAADRARALEIVEELERRRPDAPTAALSLAIAHAGTGSPATALRHLWQAHESRAVLPIVVLRDPRLDPLRDEPELLRLLEAMNLAPAPGSRGGARGTAG